jgi:hypothetical protein
MNPSQSMFAQPSTNTSLTADNSSYTFERGYPTNETIDLTYDNADLGRAKEAYKFFYPTMVTESLMRAMPPSDKPNELGFKLLVGPRFETLTPNSDTPYGLAKLDLNASGPMVIEIPPGNFIGLVDTHNMRWVLDMGNNGPDKGQGGKYLVLPPGYNGTVPSGYYVGKSDTWNALLLIRSVPTEGDTLKALKRV